MELIVCGGLRIDFVISTDGRVRLNQMGGNAIYAAVGAHIFDGEALLLAKAGENYPQEWLDKLAAKGIQPAYVQRVPGWQEMRTFYAYVDEKTRVDRDPATHFARIGRPLPPELEGYTFSTRDTQNPDSPLVLRSTDVPSNVPSGQISAPAAHLAPLALRSHFELAREFRRRRVKQITLDPGEYELTSENALTIRSCCALIDAFLPSELEVGLLLGDVGAREAAETFAGWGVPLVVIKRGPHGCLLYERDSDRFTAIPAYPANVVDVTGAGDAFSGAFAAGLWQTGDPLRSALMGAVAASLTIEGYGALYALNAQRATLNRRLDELAGHVQRD